MALIVSGIPQFSYADSELTAFEQMLLRLQTLEDLANSYKKTNWTLDSASQLVFSYIRSATYNDTKWNLLAGNVNSGFVSYVANNSPDTVNLRNTITLELPNGDIVDFIHLFAVMNMILKGNGDLGGWAGDAYQLAEEIQNLGGDPYEQARNRLRNGSFFGLADWIADLDGYNIYSMKKSGESWAQCFSRYCVPTLTEKQRVAQFITKNLGSDYTKSTVTTSSYRAKIKSKYDSAVSVMQLYDEFFGGGTIDSQYQTAAYNAVADYLYETICAPIPNESNVRFDYVNETLIVSDGIVVNSNNVLAGDSYENGSPVTPGQVLYAQGIRDVDAGSFVPSEIVEINVPVRPSAPDVPGLDSQTEDSITLVSDDALEYSLDSGETWQEEATFTGLVPGVTYSAISRYKATEVAFASESSYPLEIAIDFPEGITLVENNVYVSTQAECYGVIIASYEQGRLISAIPAAYDGRYWISELAYPDTVDLVKAFVIDEQFIPISLEYKKVW